MHTLRLHAHPSMQILTLQPPQSHAGGAFIPSSRRPGISMESQLNTRALHLKKVKCRLSQKPFSTHKSSQALPPTTGGLPAPADAHEDLPPVHPSAASDLGYLCFGPEMPYLILWLILWRDWNPFLGQCGILELFRLKKISKIIESTS